jgi:hypothetical protein
MGIVDKPGRAPTPLWRGCTMTSIRRTQAHTSDDTLTAHPAGPVFPANAGIQVDGPSHKPGVLTHELILRDHDSRGKTLKGKALSIPAQVLVEPGQRAR